MTRGRTLELFFVDDNPDGVLTAQVSNWSGIILLFPRTRSVAALSRPEASLTGVYMLMGCSDDKRMIYIGEGDNMRVRLAQHELKKVWWSKAVLVTSAGNKLNKAYAKYLESRLVKEAVRAGRVQVENGNVPFEPSLSESDRASMETFSDTLLMVLPALRVDDFVEHTRRSAPRIAPSSKDAFRLTSKKHNLEASAILINGMFVVEAGSMARLQWQRENARAATARKHAELKALGILRPNGNHCVFTSDYAFSSPIEAASVVCGRPTAGSVEWKHAASGMSYKAWEAKELKIVTNPAE